ncbi:ankyrin repeat and zinc finger domain containing protein 1 [Ophiocordyceps camponoti-floridani]|uniref:Ankyrin repeat and zinc finger domain containing protein 1 n=1 Tax=Ophiocordyceps camponoti-floridani TaxID=2030778 RepID=A0A8H4Q2T4_9HYPO|nr:ankyrin repeat and zinc finger domain containing protein 1 [Ophiocordyceps camponoti-floridani]
MASSSDDLLRRPLYIYDLPPQVLETLRLKDDAHAEAQDESPPPSPRRESSAEATISAQSCSLCALAFAAVEDQRGHLRSDLHQYNLRQKLRGQKPVSEIEFEKLVGDLSESLSGSDSESGSDEDQQESTLAALLKKQARMSNTDCVADDEGGNAVSRSKGKPPLLWFSSTVLPEKTYFGLYRTILTDEEQRTADVVAVLKKKQLAPVPAPKTATTKDIPVAYKGPHIFLCMIGGGHFAAMIVSLAPRPAKGTTSMNREATVLAHKTFHRYTTRRKQGGSQSANDNSKGNAHSAGSSLRRYNELALVQDVRALLTDWKALLDSSELLFIRATGSTNRRTLFGPYDGQVLRHNDARLRGFPFSTRRATQKELMRSFIELTRLKVRELDAAEEAKVEQPPATVSRNAPKAKATKPKLSKEEEMALLHTGQLQAFVRRSKLPAMLAYLDTNRLSPDFEFQPRHQHIRAPRPLHLAAVQNSAPMVLGLLSRAGADPCVENAEGRTAFELAGDRSTRDAFRVARSELGEKKWVWDAARVPTAMSREEANDRDERERREAEKKESERRGAEEERLKAEGPRISEAKKAGVSTLASARVKTPQERREEEARGLTAEMGMRLERERRARAAEERLRRMRSGG